MRAGPASRTDLRGRSGDRQARRCSISVGSMMSVSSGAPTFFHGRAAARPLHSLRSAAGRVDGSPVPSGRSVVLVCLFFQLRKESSYGNEEESREEDRREEAREEGCEEEGCEEESCQETSQEESLSQEKAVKEKGLKEKGLKEGLEEGFKEGFSQEKACQEGSKGEEAGGKEEARESGQEARRQGTGRETRAGARSGRSAGGSVHRRDARPEDRVEPGCSLAVSDRFEALSDGWRMICGRPMFRHGPTADIRLVCLSPAFLPDDDGPIVRRRVGEPGVVLRANA
jgi:hypothetical protein